MAEVGSAFVSIVPSAKGFGSALDKGVTKETTSVGKKLGSAFGKVFKLGAIGAIAGAGLLFKGAMDEAREAQKVTARTDSVLKSMGLSAEVSSRQIADLAGAISLKTGIDDEAIQSGENLLLTFDNVASSAGDVGGVFETTTQLAVDMSTAMGTSLTGAAKTLGRALNDPTKGMAALTRTGVQFTEKETERIKALQESGRLTRAQGLIMDKVKAKFSGAAEAMATPGDKARVAFDNLKEQIGTALLPQVDRFLTFLTEKVIPGVSDVARKVKRFFHDAKKPVKDFFDSVVGSDAFAGTVSAIASAATKMKRGFQGAKSAIEGIDFGSLDSKSIGTLLGESIANGLNTLIELAPKATAALGAMLGKVDWVGLGIEFGKQVPALLTGLAVGILAFDPLPILKGLANHWQEVLIAVLAIAFAPAKVIGPVAKILAKVPFVGPFLARALVWVNEIGGKLLKFGGEVLKSFFKGFTAGRVPGAAIVAKLISGFKGIPGAVKGFFDTLRIRLGVYALEGAEAFGAATRTGFGVVLRFIGSIPGKILSGLGNLARLLFPKGTAAIEGMWNGLKGKFTEALAWVKALPGRVVTAVGDVSDDLYDKGVALIAGFARGMLKSLQDAYDAAKSIAGKIAGLFPGSPIKEGPLKSWNNGGAGKRLMELLAKGIKDGSPKVKKAFFNLTIEWTNDLAKALERAQAQIDTAVSALASLKDAAASMRDSVASAFSTDLFSSESLSEFLTKGMAEVTNLSAVKDAIAKLRRQGVNADFLAALGQSGNSALTLQLASDPAALAQAQALFAQQQALSQDIGRSVADAKFAEAIYAQAGEIHQMRLDLMNLVPTRIGTAVGREINGSAANAQRDARSRHLSAA